MKELKYVVTAEGDFAIFTKLTSHSDVARCLYGKPIGAGFCNIAVGFSLDDNKVEKPIVNVHCYGESTSLGLKSNLKDEDVINTKINEITL